MSWRAAWNTFVTASSANSTPKGGEVDAVRLGVDHRDLVLAGDLHQAQFRPVGAFAHELGIDRDESFAAHALAECRRARPWW